MTNDDEKTTATSSSGGSGGTKLLEATRYASRIMGRHVLEGGSGSGDQQEEGSGTTSSSSSGIRVDWPGVRIDFDGPITQTSSIQLRLLGGGGGTTTFGYCLTPIVNGQEDDVVFYDDEDDLFVIVFNSSLLPCFGNKKPKDYPLLSLDSATTKLDPTKSYKLSIWKRNDPTNSGVTIVGLVVDKTCTIPLPIKPCSPLPAFAGRKLIEFVGDSNTVGFGIKAPMSGFLYHFLCQMPCLRICKAPASLIKSTDVTKSWATRVANRLNADYHIIAWSGIGIHHSWCVEGGDTNMTQAYGRLVASDPTTRVDKELPGPTPDAVVVYIGQNDFLTTYDVDQLTPHFTNFLNQIRQYRPNPIPIIIVVPRKETKMACAFTNRENKKKITTMNQVWKKAVQQFLKSSSSSSSSSKKLDDKDDDEAPNDTNIYVIENDHDPTIPNIRSKNDYGMILHWNQNANEKWARGLLPKLQDVLKWGQ